MSREYFNSLMCCLGLPVDGDLAETDFRKCRLQEKQLNGHISNLMLLVISEIGWLRISSALSAYDLESSDILKK